MTTRFWCRAAVLTAVLVVLAAPPEAAAARPLSFAIRVDGKDYLAGVGGDNGEAPPAVVWRRLAITELKPAPGVDVKPDAADPLRATIRGDVEIDVSDGGKATVKELRLVRENPTAAWTVDREDVERIAKDIGLGEVPPAAGPATQATTTGSGTTSEPSPLLGVGIGLALALFASGLLVSWMRRRVAPGPVRPVGPAETAEPPFASPE
jgi:hypothetical protein